MPRTLLRISSTALLALLIVSCRQSALTTHASMAGELLVVGPWEIPSLDPLGSGSQFMRMQVTETLVDAASDGTVLPGLAAKWSTSPDGLEWRFELRQGLRFHDGSLLTAASALPSLKRALVEPGSLALAPIERLDAIGNEVVVHLRQPFSPLPALFAHSSTQVLAPSSLGPSGEVLSVVGTGPYRVVSIARPQSFIVAAFDGWRGGVPPIRHATYLSVSRAETRALMAESGQADLVFGLDPASLSRLRANPHVTVEAVSIPRTIALKVDSGKPCFQDVRTRRAISLAIDRPRIARAILRDSEMAATQLFPPTLAGWHNLRLAPLATNPALARKLLADAGWRKTSQGLLSLDGACSSMELLTFVDRPELPLLSAVIQEQLRQVGLHVEVNIGNAGDIPFGHRAGTLTMGLMARNYGITPDPLVTLMGDFGERGGDWGAMNWRSPEIESLFYGLVRSHGAEQSLPRGRVAEILQSELPVIPIAWYRQTVVVGSSVSGVTLDPFERSYRLTGIRWAGKTGDSR
jgi:peptide/nickel transport system substrate-binding protein